jgi:proteasome accessory factor C
MRLLSVEGRWYLEGWCRRVDDVRLFRVDRILSADLLDAPAEVPEGVEPRDLSEGLFRPAPDDPVVVLDLSAAAAWVSDYYPCEEVEELADGAQRVRLRARDLQWLRRLALQMGDSVRVVEPAGLVADIAGAARAALDLYTAAPD